MAESQAAGVGFSNLRHLVRRYVLGGLIFLVAAVLLDFSLLPAVLVLFGAYTLVALVVAAARFQRFRLTSQSLQAGRASLAYSQIAGIELSARGDLQLTGNPGTPSLRIHFGGLSRNGRFILLEALADAVPPGAAAQAQSLKQAIFHRGLAPVTGDSNLRELASLYPIFGLTLLIIARIAGPISAPLFPLLGAMLSGLALVCGLIVIVGYRGLRLLPDHLESRTAFKRRRIGYPEIRGVSLHYKRRDKPAADDVRLQLADGGTYSLPTNGALIEELGHRLQPPADQQAAAVAYELGMRASAGPQSEPAQPALAVPADTGQRVFRLRAYGLLFNRKIVELLPDRLRLKKVLGSDEILFADFVAVAVVPRKISRGGDFLVLHLAGRGSHTIEIPVAAFRPGAAEALTAALAAAVPAVARQAAASEQKLAAREPLPEH
jgi:hypothetical protein